KLCGLLEKREQAVGRRRLTRTELFLTRYVEADPRGEIFDGFDEAQVIVLHQERDRRAVHAATEAVIELLVGDYVEGRRLLAVERATGLELLARFLQRHAAA